MMTDIFIPHPEIPNHYQLKPGYFLITSDLDQPHFKWSRLVRKNYLHGHGFLGHYETERIDIRAYHHDSERNETSVLNSDEIALALEQIMVEGRETIFHYYAPGEVAAIITGVEHAMLGNLSEQYRCFYYEDRK